MELHNVGLNTANRKLLLVYVLKKKSF